MTGPHDDDGSGLMLLDEGCALPDVAVAAATAAAAPTSAKNNNLLLTAPSSMTQEMTVRKNDPFKRQYFCRGPRLQQRLATRPDLPPGPSTMAVGPKWRNWQTRRTQNPVPERACGFDSHLRHLSRGRPASAAPRWRRRRSAPARSGPRAPLSGSGR